MHSKSSWARMQPDGRKSSREAALGQVRLSASSTLQSAKMNTGLALQLMASAPSEGSLCSANSVQGRAWPSVTHPVHWVQCTLPIANGHRRPMPPPPPPPPPAAKTNGMASHVIFITCPGRCQVALKRHFRKTMISSAEAECCRRSLLRYSMHWVPHVLS